MQLHSAVQRPSDKGLLLEGEAAKGSLVPRNDLKQVSCLHVPRINIVRIKCARKYDLSVGVCFQADQLSSLIRGEHSEPPLLVDIVSVN